MHPYRFPSKRDHVETHAPLGIFVTLAFVAALFVVNACAGWQKDAKTVLDIAQVGCIIENAIKPDPTVAEICKVVDDLKPAMKDVLGKHRLAAAHAQKLGAQSCAATSADAGKD